MNLSCGLESILLSSNVAMFSVLWIKAVGKQCLSLLNLFVQQVFFTADKAVGANNNYLLQLLPQSCAAISHVITHTSV